ncbi:MAG: hypothetical protein VX066_04150 [Pseudomonadota bacterium]|nr:hypothetical protein [Pseudomonadota bacterium]
MQIAVKASAATNVVVDLEHEQPVFNSPALADPQLLGSQLSGDGWESGDYSEGGNARNHPSRLYLTQVFDPVIQAFVASL